jgi:hypothetical protein
MTNIIDHIQPQLFLKNPRPLAEQRKSIAIATPWLIQAPDVVKKYIPKRIIITTNTPRRRRFNLTPPLF